MPSRTSIERVRVAGDRKIRFTLNPGDIGKCSTDNRARHSAPYWERAELGQQKKMRLGQRHRISLEATFLSGFEGKRETFFQIHGWAPNCQKAYPPVMVKFTDGKLVIETLRGVTAARQGNHRNVLRKTVRKETLVNKPITFEFDFDTTTSPGKLSASLNGQNLVADAPVSFATCASPYVKFGIYRPGGKDVGTSVVIFDDLKIEQLRK